MTKARAVVGIDTSHTSLQLAKIIEEAIRVTRLGGTVLFSSYSERFWKHRLEWFRLQAKYELIGEIDEDATGNGVIVCKDGFKAVTVGPKDFLSLISGLNIHLIITEVDDSSIFYEIKALHEKQ